MIYALTLGSSSHLNPVTWYLVDAIFCICVFYLAFFAIRSEKKRMIFLLILFVFSFFMQYSGINFFYFGSCPYESRYTLGRFFEVVPYAILGTFYFLKKEKIRLWHKGVIFFVSAIFFVVARKLPLLQSAKGFGYQGVSTFFLSVCLMMLFLSVPQIKNEKLSLALNFASSLTMGIYCMHLMAGRAWQKVFFLVEKTEFCSTFAFVALIYFSCLVASFFGWAITRKTKFLKGMFC